MTKITEIQKTQGPIEKQKEETARPSFKDVSQKWKDFPEDVQNLPWSEVPPEMLRDYLSAAAGIFEKEYGKNATQKASQLLACALIEEGRSFAISASWPAAGAQSTLEWFLEKDTASAPKTSLVFQTDKEVSPENISDILLEYNPRPRLIFDPFVSLPDKDLVLLMKNWEKEISDADAAMHCATAFLMMWCEAEKNNSANMQIKLSGLTQSGEELASGQSVVLSLLTNMLDREENFDQTQEKEYQITFKPS